MLVIIHLRPRLFKLNSSDDFSITIFFQLTHVPRSSQGFFLLSSTFQIHFVQLIKPSQAFVRPTGIQALPSPVNSTII